MSAARSRARSNLPARHPASLPWPPPPPQLTAPRTCFMGSAPEGPSRSRIIWAKKAAAAGGRGSAASRASSGSFIRSAYQAEKSSRWVRAAGRGCGCAGCVGRQHAWLHAGERCGSSQRLGQEGQGLPRSPAPQLPQHAALSCRVPPGPAACWQPPHPTSKPQRPAGLTLRLVVVHAVLAGQGLDQVLERGVAPHVVAQPDGGLHAQQHRGEGGVEALQVVGQLVHHRAQARLCGCERGQGRAGRRPRGLRQWLRGCGGPHRCVRSSRLGPGIGQTSELARQRRNPPAGTHPSSPPAARAGCC